MRKSTRQAVPANRAVRVRLKSQDRPDARIVDGVLASLDAGGVKENHDGGAVMRAYNAATNQYTGRPNWPGMGGGVWAVAGWQARHHITPWSHLRDRTLNVALKQRDTSKKDFAKAMKQVKKLAGSKVAINNTTLKPQNLGNTASDLADDLFGIPDNVFIGPSEAARDDDPGNDGVDHHMDARGQEYEASKKYAALDAYPNLDAMKGAIDKLPHKQTAPAPYVEDEWTWGPPRNAIVAPAARANWKIRFGFRA